MMAASAGVVLPPKLKSALPPVTACSVGAWFGNGPSHSTLMPSFASSFSNSPRSLAIRLRPLRPQVRRTLSVVRPSADKAFPETPMPARAPTPAAAVPRKRRRVGCEKSVMAQSLPRSSGSDGRRRNDAEFGEQFCAQYWGGAVTLGAMLEGNPAFSHHQDAIGQRDGLVNVVRDQQDTGPVGLDQFTDECVHADAGQRIERGKGFIKQKE